MEKGKVEGAMHVQFYNMDSQCVILYVISNRDIKSSVNFFLVCNI